MSQTVKASLLLFFFSLCGSAMWVTHLAREHRPSPEPRELFAVVNDQLAALRAADYTGAYRHSATGVQQKFTLRQFEKMVLRSYGEITQGQRVEFGSVNVQGSSASVHVFLFARNGTSRSFLFSLVAEGNSWKIGDVQELRSYREDRALAGTHA